MIRQLQCALYLVSCIASQLPSYAEGSIASVVDHAKISELHGSVYVNHLSDWASQPGPERVQIETGQRIDSDKQITTGIDALAQVNFHNSVVRAAQNSVYAVAPKQRLVLLRRGEVLLQVSQPRKQKTHTYLWTDHIQARIGDATILVQNAPHFSRLTVLDGSAEVLNKVDRSVIALTPGVVCEITDLAASPTDAALPKLQLDSSPTVPVFETSRTRTVTYLANPMSLINHCLLRQFDSRLPSIADIRETVTSRQSAIESDKVRHETIAKLMRESTTIQCAPRSFSYRIGANVNRYATLPSGVLDFFVPTATLPPLATRN